jgi:transketolase
MSNSKQMAARIRKYCVEIAHGPNAVHIGGSLSMTDILAVLFSDVLKHDPKNPKWEQRDRLIISKGHSCTAYYSALACAGYISEEELMTQYQNGSLISGHVSHHVNGVEISTGSLGHGLPIASGMALAAKNNGKDHRVYVIMGDGECEEGTTWEAALFAARYGLGNLTAIVDANTLQSADTTLNVLGLGRDNIARLFENAGWHVIKVDGHDHDELKKALSTSFNDNRPICVVALTTKGKGVSFMENNPMYHSNKLPDQLYEQALKELEGAS